MGFNEGNAGWMGGRSHLSGHRRARVYFWAAALVLLLLKPALGLAETFDPAPYLQNLAAVLEDPLPPMATVVPGYRRPETAAPTLLSADLTSETADALPWGRVVGQLLRWKLMFPPGAAMPLRMPDVNTYYQDAWSYETKQRGAGMSIESLLLLGKRLGISNALTGHLKITPDTFALDLQLRQLPAARPGLPFHFAGPLNDLPDALNQAVLQVYAALGVTLSPETVQELLRSPPGTFAGIELTVRVRAEMEKAPGEELQLLEAVHLDGVDNSLLAALHLFHLSPGQDLFAYHARLDQIASPFPADPGIALSVARYMGYRNYPHLLDVKLGRLKALVRDNPQDPTAMIILGDVLTGGKNHADALVVCRESIERWPDNYRAWWNMSWALLEYAWQLRGTTFWDEVPEKAKRLFPALRQLAGEAIDRAIALHPDQAELRVLKMRSIGHYSPELMDQFHTGIRLAPKNRDLYTTAMNYSLPQWGGSYKAQEYVWKLAVDNVHDEAWLKELRRKYVKKPPFAYRMLNLYQEFLSLLFLPIRFASTATSLPMRLTALAIAVSALILILTLIYRRR